jgi:hypothetical protein
MTQFKRFSDYETTVFTKFIDYFFTPSKQSNLGSYPTRRQGSEGRERLIQPPHRAV